MQKNGSSGNLNPWGVEMTDYTEKAREILVGVGFDDDPDQPEIQLVAAALQAAADEALERAAQAVLCPPPELYPDKTTDEETAVVARRMGAICASGYFHERALHTAANWHVAAIRALKSRP